MSVPIAMEALSSTINALVQKRQHQRADKAWDAADATRRALEQIRVGIYRVQLDDDRQGGTWHWTADQQGESQE